MKTLLILSVALNCYLVYRLREPAVIQTIVSTHSAIQKFDQPSQASSSASSNPLVTLENSVPCQTKVDTNISKDESLSSEFAPQEKYEVYQKRIEAWLTVMMRDELQIPEEKIEKYDSVLRAYEKKIQAIYDKMEAEKRTVTIEERELITRLNRERHDESRKALGKNWAAWEKFAQDFNTRVMSGVTAEEIMGEAKPDSTWGYVIPI